MSKLVYTLSNNPYTKVYLQINIRLSQTKSRVSRKGLQRIAQKPSTGGVDTRAGGQKRSHKCSVGRNKWLYITVTKSYYQLCR